MPNPFVVMGVEHEQQNLHEILLACEKNFKKGDKILVELPESVILLSIAANQIIEKGEVSGEILLKLKNHPSATLASKGFSSLLHKHIALAKSVSKVEREYLLDEARNSFAYQLVEGLLRRGMTPLPGASKFAYEMGKAPRIIKIGANEEFFKKRVIKAATSGEVAGAIYDSIHAPVLKRTLEQNGFGVKLVLAKTPFKSRVARAFSKPFYAIARLKQNARKNRRR